MHLPYESYPDSKCLGLILAHMGARGGHGRLVMSKSPDSLERNAAMTKTEAKPAIAAVNELFAKSRAPGAGL